MQSRISLNADSVYSVEELVKQVTGILDTA
jgi:hypothetical protein